jgi:hypothetical protein
MFNQRKSGSGHDCPDQICQQWDLIQHCVLVVHKQICEISYPIRSHLYMEPEHRNLTAGNLGDYRMKFISREAIVAGYQFLDQMSHVCRALVCD